MRIKFISMALIALLFCPTYVFAEQGHSQYEHKGSMTGHMKEEVLSVVEVGNKICPVSGKKTDAMGLVVPYEYKGKIYNFCCEGCVRAFKSDPEKYIKIIEEQMEHKEETHA